MKKATPVPKALRPVCRTCGKPVLYGDLYCSRECGQAPKVAHEQLRAQGFTQSAETPNVYTRDGIAVTVEQVSYMGIDAALRVHRATVEAAQK